MNQAPDFQDKYCFRCGGRLDVSNPSLHPVPGLPGRRQWSVETVCSKCGEKGGTSWAPLEKVDPSSPSHAAMQRTIELNMGVDENWNSLDFLGSDGRLDFAGMVRAYPLSVFGLKGHPLGLRFSSPGLGSSANWPNFERIYNASFRYIVGNYPNPEKTLFVRLNKPVPELDSIAEVARTAESFRDGTFHRDWNEEQIQQVSRQRTTVQIGGRTVDVDLATWEQPQRVTLASLGLAGCPATAASLNLTHPELLIALVTLVALREDTEAVKEHQQDLDENLRIRRQR